MTEQSAASTNRSPADVVDRVGARMEGTLERLFGGLSAESVFGAPQRFGDRVVFTAASLRRSGGFGFGAGIGETDGEEPREGGGGGGGGGGQAGGRPVAVIELDGDRVRVKPILDYTALGLTLLVGVTVVKLVTAFRKPKRSRWPLR